MSVNHGSNQVNAGAAPHKIASGNPVDFFCDRWNHMESLSSASLCNQIEPLSIQDTLTSLAIRGGFSSMKNSYIELQSNSIQTTAPSYDMISYASDYLNIQHKESSKKFEALSKDSRRLQRPQHGSRWMKPSNLFNARLRKVLKVSITVTLFKLSDILFFSGTHLETLWGKAKPAMVRRLSTNDGIIRIGNRRFSYQLASHVA